MEIRWKGNAAIVVELNKFTVNYANTLKVLYISFQGNRWALPHKALTNHFLSV